MMTQALTLLTDLWLAGYILLDAALWGRYFSRLIRRIPMEKEGEGVELPLAYCLCGAAWPLMAYLYIRELRENRAGR